MVPMGDEKAHQVAVAHCVDGLHDDFIEIEAGWQVLRWDCCRPVHPITALLIKEVVMNAAILQDKVDNEHSHVCSCKTKQNTDGCKCSHV